MSETYRIICLASGVLFFAVVLGGLVAVRVSVGRWLPLIVSRAHLWFLIAFSSWPVWFALDHINLPTWADIALHTFTALFSLAASFALARYYRWLIRCVRIQVQVRGPDS